MAMSQEHGSTLQEVQQLMKKNQVRKSNQPTYSNKDTDINTYVFTIFFPYLFHTFTFGLLFIVSTQNLKLPFSLLLFLDASEGVTGPQRQD